MDSLDAAPGLKITPNEPLKPYTTFKIGGPAKYFALAGSAQDFSESLDFGRAENLPTFVLGGGSNILVSDRGFDGLVVHPINKGVIVLAEDGETVSLGINAAEVWDQVVAYAVERGWWGIENLSHIPGQAGAALVQNIGAYGQQISDVFSSAEVMDKATGAVTTLGARECGLGYRKSIFNTSRKGRLIILHLTLRLAKRGRPSLQYPDVRAYFERRGIEHPRLAEIRQAIIAIRDLKFPFPREERGGNAGSFFKNLLLMAPEYATLEDNIREHLGPEPATRLRELKDKFPTPGLLKIPTAFLMEVCGLKGYCVGQAKVNETQPLVLLNQGGATARDVMSLARHVRRTIYSKTGMTVALEPELVGFSQAELADYLALN